MTRIQKERFEDINEYNKLKGIYILNNDKLNCAWKMSDFNDFTHTNKRGEHIGQNVYEPFFR